MNRMLLLGAALSAIIGFSAVLSGCGWLVVEKESGPVVTKTFDLSDFDSVGAGNAFVLTISQADNFSVKVTARDSLFRYVKVSKTGRTLRIGVDGRYISFGSGSRPLEAAITMPELVGLGISGATTAVVKGFDSKEDLTADVSGASSLELAATTGAFSCKSSGSSKVTLAVKSPSVTLDQSGASSMLLDIETGDFQYGSTGSSEASGTVKATKTSVDLSGASDLRLTGSGGDIKMTESGSSGARLNGFIVGDADIQLSGASDADIDIEGKLDLTLSGASNLKYGGNPTFGQRMDVTGGSNIERR